MRSHTLSPGESVLEPPNQQETSHTDVLIGRVRDDHLSDSLRAQERPLQQLWILDEIQPEVQASAIRTRYEICPRCWTADLRALVQVGHGVAHVQVSVSLISS